MAKEKPLTQRQRKKIWEAINACDDKSDRSAEEVIKKDFHGDRDAYLRTMAKFHSIPLN